MMLGNIYVQYFEAARTGAQVCILGHVKSMGFESMQFEEVMGFHGSQSFRAELGQVIWLLRFTPNLWRTVEHADA